MQDAERWRRLIDTVRHISAPDVAAMREAVDLGADVVSAWRGGCSITEIGPDGTGRTPVASDETALLLDRAQYAADNGPCLAAARTGSMVRVHLGAAPPVYPAFTATAARLDVHGSMSLPLAVPARTAALNFYTVRRGGFDSRSVAVARLLARCTSALWTGVPPTADSAHDPDWTAARHRALGVERAIGFLLDRDGLTEDEAWSTLLSEARAGGESMSAVAGRIDRCRPGAASSAGADA